METGGQSDHAIQPEVNAVTVPIIKVPSPSQAVCGATRLPTNPPAAEQSAPAMGPKKIPESGDKAAANEKLLPVPSIGTEGITCDAETKAAQTAITAGWIREGKDKFLSCFSVMLLSAKVYHELVIYGSITITHSQLPILYVSLY